MRVKRFLAPVLTLAFLSVGVWAEDPRAGLWTSEGYGLFLRIDSSQIVASEITSVSCLPAWTAARVADQGNGWVFHGGFASGDEVVRIYPCRKFKTRRYCGDPTTWRRWFSIAFCRLRDRACGHAEDTPLANYDVFWTTFAENYPFFGRHGVDWDATGRKFRPLVTSKTSPDELFSVFSQMLEPLRDAHVVLDVFPPGTPRGKDWLKTPVQELWLHKPDAGTVGRCGLRAGKRQSSSPGTSTGRCKRFAVARFGSDWCAAGPVGYLGVLSFHQYTADDDLPAGLACIRAAGDAIFAKNQSSQRASSSTCEAMAAGEDAFVLELASRLTDRRYLAFGKQARLTSTKKVQFTARDSIFVEPSEGPKYAGDAVLLTGRHSASAAETFTMALMGRRPGICRVGENTQGVFSDVLDRRLPNGWRIVLPNEIYLTAEGRSFDVSGVPPDIAVAGFSRKDLSASAIRR